MIFRTKPGASLGAPWRRHHDFREFIESRTSRKLPKNTKGEGRGCGFLVRLAKGYDFRDQTGRIVGCALEVHKELGRFFQETTYQTSLAYELQGAGLEFSRECWVDVLYKGAKVDKRRVDFIVDDILVETKAKAALEEVDLMQTLSYLKATGFRLGLLINFGSEKLEVRRLVYDPEKEQRSGRTRPDPG